MAGTVDRLSELIAGKDALVVGPGIGVSEDTKRLIEYLLTEAVRPDCPLVQRARLV